jgi:hypothetical protein
MNGIIVDLFAGGGGASEGIRLALGRCPDVAINHDADRVLVLDDDYEAGEGPLRAHHVMPTDGLTDAHVGEALTHAEAGAVMKRFRPPCLVIVDDPFKDGRPPACLAPPRLVPSIWPQIVRARVVRAHGAALRAAYEAAFYGSPPRGFKRSEKGAL